MNKKTKFLKIGVLALFFAVIMTSTVVAGTFAKFVSVINGGARSQAAGFMVSDGTTSQQNTLNANVMIAPGESKTVGNAINYFAQVNTEVSVNSDSVTGYGALANFTTLASGFDTWLQTNYGKTQQQAEAVERPSSLSEMFTIAITDGVNAVSGTSLAEQIAGLIRSAGTLGGSGVYVAAMGAEATQALTVNLVTTITWNTISDEWDTYVGNEIADLAIITTENLTSTKSGVNVGLQITISQYLGEMPAEATLANTGWVFNATPNTAALEDNTTYDLEFTSGGVEYKGIEKGSIYYIRKSDSQPVKVYDDEGGWVNDSYKTINVTGGSDATLATLRTWVQNNATAKITDLTGTTWSFNLPIPYRANFGTYSVNYVFGNEENLGTSLYMGAYNVSGPSQQLSNTQEVNSIVLCGAGAPMWPEPGPGPEPGGGTPDHWALCGAGLISIGSMTSETILYGGSNSNLSRLAAYGGYEVENWIRFTGGTDATNSTLIDWVYTYCTRRETYSITNNLTNLTANGPSNILNNESSFVTLVTEAGFYLPINVTVTGASYTYDSSSGMIALTNPTANITITAVGEATLPIRQSLQQYSWSEVSEIAKMIAVSDNPVITAAAYNIAMGDTKSYNSGSTLKYARIIGFNHDNVSSASQTSYGANKAGITFETTTTFNSYQINSSNDNISWADSNARAALTSILNYFDSDLSNVIVQVDKVTANDCTTTPTTASITSDKLWLMSITEIVGLNNQRQGGSGALGNSIAEGSQYQYYIENSSNSARIKTNFAGSEGIYWLRSPYGIGSYSYSFFRAIDESGALYSRPVSYTNGISPCFCL